MTLIKSQNFLSKFYESSRRYKKTSSKQTSESIQDISIQVFSKNVDIGFIASTDTAVNKVHHLNMELEKRWFLVNLMHLIKTRI